jgi:hypothetical protein
LNITGTSGNDNFVFVAGAVRHSINLNGVPLAVDTTSVDIVAFNGEGGSDTASIYGRSTGVNTLVLNPGAGTLTGTGYEVSLRAPNITCPAAVSCTRIPVDQPPKIRHRE